MDNPDPFKAESTLRGSNFLDPPDSFNSGSTPQGSASLDTLDPFSLESIIGSWTIAPWDSPITSFNAGSTVSGSASLDTPDPLSLESIGSWTTAPWDSPITSSNAESTLSGSASLDTPGSINADSIRGSNSTPLDTPNSCNVESTLSGSASLDASNAFSFESTGDWGLAPWDSPISSNAVSTFSGSAPLDTPSSFNADSTIRGSNSTPSDTFDSFDADADANADAGATYWDPPQTYVDMVQIVIPSDMLEAIYLLSSLPSINIKPGLEPNKRWLHDSDNCRDCGPRSSTAKTLIEKLFPMPPLKRLAEEWLKAMLETYNMVFHLAVYVANDPILKHSNPEHPSPNLTGHSTIQENTKHLIAQLIYHHRYASALELEFWNLDIGFPWIPPSSRLGRTMRLGRNDPGPKRYTYKSLEIDGFIPNENDTAGIEYKISDELEIEALGRVIENNSHLVAEPGELVGDAGGKITGRKVISSDGSHLGDKLGMGVLKMADLEKVYKLCTTEMGELRLKKAKEIVWMYYERPCVVYEHRSWLKDLMKSL